jgi:hypothetical protein
MKTYWEVEVYSHAFLALNGGEWSASCPDHFVSRERAPGTHQIRDWVGHRDSVEDEVAKGKYPCPCWELSPIHPVCSLVTLLSELSWLQIKERVFSPPSPKITENTFTECCIKRIAYKIRETRLTLDKREISQTYNSK